MLINVVLCHELMWQYCNVSFCFLVKKKKRFVVLCLFQDHPLFVYCLMFYVPQNKGWRVLFDVNRAYKTENSILSGCDTFFSVIIFQLFSPPLSTTIQQLINTSPKKVFNCCLLIKFVIWPTGGSFESKGARRIQKRVTNWIVFSGPLFNPPNLTQQTMLDNGSGCLTLFK